MSEVKYQIELTERQVTLLSYACDRLSRIIQGQDGTYQEFMEHAWEKRCKERTGNFMDKSWDGGWYEMRADAEELCKKMKARFWGLRSNELWGVHYDEDADVLYDIHQVLRHQLWLDRPDSEKLSWTTDASEAMKYGDEPLITIKRVKK